MPTYTYLVNDILNATENTGSEFVDYIPYMVNKAEERLVKDLDDYGLVTYTSIAVSANKNIVTLPTGTRVVKNFNIKSDGTKINLLLRTDEFINDYWPVSASVGEPKYYAPRTNTNVLIAPTAASTYDGEIVHISRPVTLSSAADSNYFSEYCYDLLFYGSMVEALMFQKDYATMQVFEGKYKQLLELQRNQARRTRRDDMQVPASPAGGDNTLVPNSN